jgi:hypothetical protein
MERRQKPDGHATNTDAEEHRDELHVFEMLIADNGYKNCTENRQQDKCRKNWE